MIWFQIANLQHVKQVGDTAMSVPERPIHYLERYKTKHSHHSSVDCVDAQMNVQLFQLPSDERANLVHVCHE